MSSCEDSGEQSDTERQILEYPTHAVSSEGGGTVLRPWISIWLLIILSPRRAITCHVQGRPLYKIPLILMLTVQWNPETFFLKTAAD